MAGADTATCRLTPRRPFALPVILSAAKNLRLTGSGCRLAPVPGLGFRIWDLRFPAPSGLRACCTGPGLVESSGWERGQLAAETPLRDGRRPAPGFPLTRGGRWPTAYASRESADGNSGSITANCKPTPSRTDADGRVSCLETGHSRRSRVGFEFWLTSDRKGPDQDWRARETQARPGALHRSVPRRFRSHDTPMSFPASRANRGIWYEPSCRAAALSAAPAASCEARGRDSAG